MRLGRPLGGKFGRQLGGDLQEQYPLYTPEMLAAHQEQMKAYAQANAEAYAQAHAKAHAQAEAHAKSQQAKREAKRKNRATRFTINGVLMLGLMLTAIWGWQGRDIAIAHLLTASADMGLALKTIRVNGRVNLSHDHIQTAIAMPPGAPLLGADLPAIATRLNNLGWVKAARVERHFPDTLEITISERQALALYQGADAHHVIDTQGEIITGVRPEDFRHLPVVSGSGARSKAHAIIPVLKTAPELYSEVWSLTLQSERRWDVFWKNNVRIQLPEHDIESAWRRLAEMEAKHGLSGRNLISIDLREAGRLVLRLDRALTNGELNNDGGGEISIHGGQI